MYIEEVEDHAWRWLTENSPDRAQPRTSSSCAIAVAQEVSQLPEKQGSNIVLPLINGYLDLVEKDDGIKINLREAKREDGLTYLLSCAFDENAKATEFDKFLSQVLPDEAVRKYVQEYIGYTLLPDCRFQRAQFWLGSGANGKSTLAEIVGALHERPIALQLDALDGFNLIGLLDASLVYVDETPARINEQKLKAIISGGMIQIDRKYREPLNVRPTAKIIICGNIIPAVSDQSHGFWRRLPIIPFTQSFGESQIDPMLAKRIIKNEMSGVLNWALEGLRRLLARGRFGEAPEAVLNAIAGGKTQSNSVMGWWYSNEDHEVHQDASNAKDDVFDSYKIWCIKNNMSPVSSPKFWMRLKDVAGEFKESRPTINGKRVQCVNLYI